MGRFSGLSAALSTVAEALKKERETKQAIKLKQGSLSPFERFIQKSEAVDASETLGRPDIAKAIRDSIGSPVVADQGVAVQKNQGSAVKNILGNAPQKVLEQTSIQDTVSEPTSIGIPKREPLKLPSDDLIYKTFKQETNAFGETKLVSDQIISRQALINEKMAGEATKAIGKQLETLMKVSGQLSRVENSFSGLVGQMKRTVNEQGGFGAIAAIKGRTKRFIQRLGLREKDTPLEEQFGGLAGFEAQRQEVILALSPILTGQNRILRSALTMLKKTVPDLPIFGTTEAEFAENVRQSMKNAFKLSLGIARGLVTPQEIINLNENGSTKEITSFITGLVKSTRFTQSDETYFNNFFKRVMSTPATEAIGVFEPGEQKFSGEPKFKSIRRGGQPTGISIDAPSKKHSHLSDQALDAKIQKLRGKQ